ncbi:MAG: conserved hypothetical regulatory protein [Solirubrobacterales bacterium]|nr:conserved hypothetical regulatory protein [Solirubrobacterales bacterium]
MSVKGLAGTHAVNGQHMHLDGSVPQSLLPLRLRRVPALHTQLRASAGVSELLAQAADLARVECGFARALVLSVTQGQLVAPPSGALGDPASEDLRRAVLAEPVALVRDTPEAELVRRGGRTVSDAARPRGRSVLAERLLLEHHHYSPVVVNSRTIALLVVDRSLPAVLGEERAWVDLFTSLVAIALGDVVLRLRVAELAQEMQHFHSSTHALVRLATDGAIELPDGRSASRQPPSAGGGRREDVRPLLGEREWQVAELLARGRSNRQIAEELVVSAETVKTHVSRILRKLHAHNRAEAAGLLARLEHHQAPFGRRD